MKSQKDIQTEIEAILHVAEELTQVEPSIGLKGRIMAGIQAEKEPSVVPFYRRVSFAAAAAVVILAVNAVTLVHYLRPQQATQDSTVQTDPYADIRAAYSLDDMID